MNEITYEANDLAKQLSDIGWEADKAGDTEKGDLFFALSDEATMVAIHSQVANPETAAAVLADIRKRAGL